MHWLCNRRKRQTRRVWRVSLSRSSALRSTKSRLLRILQRTRLISLFALVLIKSDPSLHQKHDTGHRSLPVQSVAGQPSNHHHAAATPPTTAAVPAAPRAGGGLQPPAPVPSRAQHQQQQEQQQLRELYPHTERQQQKTSHRRCRVGGPPGGAAAEWGEQGTRRRPELLALPRLPRLVRMRAAAGRADDDDGAVGDEGRGGGWCVWVGTGLLWVLGGTDQVEVLLPSRRVNGHVDGCMHGRRSRSSSIK